MKLLFDFFPVLLFFIAYKFGGIYVATMVAVLASCIQVAYSWIKQRRMESMQLFTLVLILLLGGATLFLQNEIFIKWKPSVVNWAFAILFIGSEFIGGKPLIQRFIESNLQLSTPVWLRLNRSWTVFFTLSGLLNLYVVYHFDTDTWVNFKLFGMVGLTLGFVVLQAVYLAKYVKRTEPHG